MVTKHRQPQGVGGQAAVSYCYSSKKFLNPFLNRRNVMLSLSGSN